jgi:hypothetical protein
MRRVNIMKQKQLVKTTLLIFIFIIGVVQSTHARGDRERLPSDRPIVFEGVEYSPREFDEVRSRDGIENLVFVNSDDFGANSRRYYAFTDMEELVAFTEEQGIGPSSGVDDGIDILPHEIEGDETDPSASSSGCPTYPASRYYDGTYCSGSSISTTFDLANLSTIGSDWSNRISSLDFCIDITNLKNNINKRTFLGTGQPLPSPARTMLAGSMSNHFC